MLPTHLTHRKQKQSQRRKKREVYPTTPLSIPERIRPTRPLLSDRCRRLRLLSRRRRSRGRFILFLLHWRRRRRRRRWCLLHRINLGCSIRHHSHGHSRRRPRVHGRTRSVGVIDWWRSGVHSVGLPGLLLVWHLLLTTGGVRVDGSLLRVGVARVYPCQVVAGDEPLCGELVTV